MPFSKKIELEYGILGIWDIQEPVQELQSEYLFTEKEKNDFEMLRSERRQTEYLATRLLLQRLLGHKSLIYYTSFGKPYLIDQSNQISISHCSDTVAIFVSKRKAGVDIEKANRNIDKVTRRFLHSEEIEQIKKSSHQQTEKIVYWGAKEAVFKCTDLHGIRFNEQIRINPFDYKQEGKFSAYLLNSANRQDFLLGYFTYKDNVIVYCVEK